MKKLTEQKLRRIIRKEIMEQQRVDEGFFTIALSVAAGIFVFKIAVGVLKGFIRQFGLRKKLPKDELLKINDQVWDEVRDKVISSDRSGLDVVKVELMRKDFAKKIKSGEITTIKQITDTLQKAAKK
jgi:hypothetical protein